MDKVIEERESVVEMFKNLEFYIENFKPVSQIKPEHRDKVVKFLDSAYECHLKTAQKPDEEEVFPILNHTRIILFDYIELWKGDNRFDSQAQQPKRKKSKKEPCELCLAKEQLKVYEGVIVDNLTNMKAKEMEQDIKRDVYSYKAPYQEAILKSKISYIPFA